MTRVKTIQYVPQTIDNSSNSHLICFQMQKKSTKHIAKISYDALSSLIMFESFETLSVEFSTNPKL